MLAQSMKFEPAMPPFRDLTGMEFGRLTVLYRAAASPTRRGAYWTCRCNCGSETTIKGGALVTGNTKSCGCLGRENLAALPTLRSTHDGSSDPEYWAWHAMKQRCEDRGHPSYENYGARGITVDPRWSASYEAFIADVGHRPSPQHSLDRINNNCGYEPGNVRWATKKEQQNNRRVSVSITHDGRTDSISGWSESLGISRRTLQSRHANGWSDERIVTTPVGGKQ
jgi:hypothetical protein